MQNKYRGLDPFDYRSKFVKAYLFEIKSGHGWFKYYQTIREYDRDDRFLLNDPPFPCLVGIYWWREQAKLYGFSDSAIRARMSEITGKKVPETFFRKMSKLFFDAPLNSPRAVSIVELGVDQKSFPRGELMWAFVASCFELIMMDKGPSRPKKSRGRTPNEKIFASAIDRRKPMKLKVKAYANERGVAFSSEDLITVAIYIESVVSAVTHEVAANYKSPGFDIADLDPIEVAIKRSNNVFFYGEFPDQFGILRLKNQLQILTGIVARGIDRNIELAKKTEDRAKEQSREN